MSKMSDMAMTIEELRSAAAAINEAASWLAEQFSGTADKAPAKEPAANSNRLTTESHSSGKPVFYLEDI